MKNLPQTSQSQSAVRYLITALALVAVLAAVFLSFRPVLKAEFLNWDDGVHVTENPYIRSVEPDKLRYLFSRVFNNTYIPLTMVTFAVEYHLYGYDAYYFHRNNLIGHMTVTALVFWFAMLMTRSLGASILAALIFGLHPMRVEAVAWITARKDVLYSSFYMLALIAYVYYCRGSRIRYLAAAWILGVLSILSKPMGLSLPLVLPIIDWFAGRRWHWKLLGEKMLFFLYAVPIAYFTYQQHPRMALFSYVEGFFNLAWSFTFYLKKFFFPGLLIPLYHMPIPYSLYTPDFAVAFLLMAAFLAGGWIFRRQRWFMFAWLFYTASIFYLCRFIRFDPQMDKNLVADRFMYMASLGICLALGVGIDRLWRELSRLRPIAGKCFLAFLVLFFSAMGAKTWRQTFAWQNSQVFWDYELENSPQSDSREKAREEWKFYANRSVAYLNRGILSHADGKLDQALDDYNTALRYNSVNPMAHNNRGLVYLKQGKLSQAYDEFQLAILTDPTYGEAYINRGVIQAMNNKSVEAFNDFNQGILLKPENPFGFVNRGNWLRKHGLFEQALRDANQALFFKSDSLEALYLRCRIFLELGNIDQARQDAGRLIDMGITLPEDLKRDLEGRSPMSGL